SMRGRRRRCLRVRALLGRRSPARRGGHRIERPAGSPGAVRLSDSRRTALEVRARKVMRALIRLPGLLVLGARPLSRRARKLPLRPLFRKAGTHFRFDPDGHYSFSTIEVGDNVFLGPGAFLSASESFIHIGKKVMFGPNVTVLGGDHRLDVVGVHMADVTE